MSYPLDPSEGLRLRSLSDLEIAKRIPNASLDKITAFARKHFGVATCLVTVIEAERQLIVSKEGFDGSETPRRVAFCSYTIVRPDVLVVPDARLDPRFKENPLVTGPPHIRFYAGAPLVYQEEVRLGALCLIDPKPRQFSRGERAELAMLAEFVVSVMVARALNLPEPDLTAALSI